MAMSSVRPTIAVFDSGVGGMTILAALAKQIPRAKFLYYGDTAHAPYGQRSAEEIFTLSQAAVTALLVHRPAVIVIACNTVTSTSITALREKFPAVPFVGVEPAIKPGAAASRRKKIIVAATTATLHSESYRNLKNQWANGVEVIDLPKPTWVKMIEENTSVDEILTRNAQEILATGADVLVLACTHFPFIKPKLHRLLPGMTIIDSAAPVAAQVQRVLATSRPESTMKDPEITWIFSSPHRPTTQWREKLWTIARQNG